MKLSRAFYKGLFFTTFINIADICSTYYVTPDLSNEGNYWVQKYSLGWTGFLFVMIVYQIIYMVPYYYHTEIFKKPKYAYRKSNNLIEVIRIYFISDPRIDNFFKKSLNCLKGVFNYAGYHCILFYIASKLLFTINNVLMGMLLKNATLLSITNGVKNLHIDGKTPFWSSNIGKLLIWYSQFDLETKNLFQYKLSLSFEVCIFLYFVLHTYKMAVSTRMQMSVQRQSTLIKL